VRLLEATTASLRTAGEAVAMPEEVGR
jgi:hypothetical protein